MGLDDFLIPQESLPVGGSPPLDDLDGILVSPPINPDAAPESAGPVAAVPPAASPIGVPLQTPAEVPVARGRGFEPAAALAAGVIIAPPSGPRVESTRAASTTWHGADAPAARNERPFVESAEVAGKLEGFLATAGELPVSRPAEVGRIESEFISTTPLEEYGRAPDIPTPPASASGMSWPEDFPVGPAERRVRWSDRPSTPPRFGGLSDALTDGAPLDDGYERIEARLSGVADRLERAAERFAPPTLPLGSRPRPFRGRVDG